MKLDRSPTSTPIPDAAASGVGCVERERAVRPSLSRAACLALLAGGGHGRVAATMKAVPVIIPVSFTLVDENVIFRTDSDEAIARAVANAVVAFETDQVGAGGRLAWSVHAIGVARSTPVEAGKPAPAGLGFGLRPEVLTGWQAAPEGVT